MSRWRGRLLVLVAGGVLTAIVLLALFADRVAPAGPNDQDISARLRPPAMVGGTWSRPLGTDELGRDVLSRLLHGGRVSLMVGLLAVAVSCPLGVVIGLASGFFGGWIDRMLMRFTDIQLAIPTILLAMALVTVLGPGVPNLIITLSVTGWTIYARLIRGETLALRDRDFIEATRAAGAGQARIMFRHVLPNVVSPVIVVATFAVGSMVVLEATLSFLGIGVPLRVATWGSMLSSGRTYLKSAWWITAFPGLAIFVTVLAINALGDSMRDALDPRLRSRV
ncbi:MAG TPA: ABC transporter permease [Candidatus Limnocylindria bacterium]|nr:ABC transporter permease [Candidatus Limnocylindria bacterium]